MHQCDKLLGLALENVENYTSEINNVDRSYGLATFVSTLFGVPPSQC